MRGSRPTASSHSTPGHCARAGSPCKFFTNLTPSRDTGGMSRGTPAGGTEAFCSHESTAGSVRHVCQQESQICTWIWCKTQQESQICTWIWCKTRLLCWLQIFLLGQNGLLSFLRADFVSSFVQRSDGGGWLRGIWFFAISTSCHEQGQHWQSCR